jgi:hypothetical protein
MQRVKGVQVNIMDNTAQEAEAEGVRPLSEEDVQRMTIRAKDILAVADGEGWPLNDLARLLAEEALIVLAVVKAERTELERKEAEAAALREALLFVRPYMEGAHFNRVDAREIIWAQARRALNTTQAGAALLERVQQLEGELKLGNLGTEVAMELEFDCKQRPQEISRRTRQALVKWQELRDHQRDHQGTGAAGEGE